MHRTFWWIALSFCHQLPSRNQLSRSMGGTDSVFLIWMSSSKRWNRVASIWIGSSDGLRIAIASSASGIPCALRSSRRNPETLNSNAGSTAGMLATALTGLFGSQHPFRSRRISSVQARRRRSSTRSLSSAGTSEKYEKHEKQEAKRGQSPFSLCSLRCYREPAVGKTPSWKSAGRTLPCELALGARKVAQKVRRGQSPFLCVNRRPARSNQDVLPEAVPPNIVAPIGLSSIKAVAALMGSAMTNPAFTPV